MLEVARDTRWFCPLGLGRALRGTTVPRLALKPQANGWRSRYRCDVAPTENPLANEPFSWLSRADGAIVIRYHDAPVTLLRGKAAEKFTARVRGAEGAAAQQLMARATGNFKRGNERKGKQQAR